ncbi:MAG TPA: hydrogenase maturation nickel metallochaperone HypA [Lachnospiraceae bacterium]|nr:hydrogenase maturation nickel metallochaperone HypA [Lachnospiraceae bacterium]HEX3077912.1 hydrogenase maturation nickel metallochaperone HypA [Lachnospiraceae bacterium]
MHELGVVIEVVRTIEKIAKEQQLTKIDTVILQIGELSSMIPKYVEQCYPAAVDKTILQDTRLKIEVLPGNALCSKCSKVFNLLKNQKSCPHCDASSFEIISGREFFIKEVIAY